MKGIDLFCSSSASTSICSSMDQRSMVRNRHLGGNRRPFDPHQHVRSSADGVPRRSRRRGSTTTATHPVSTKDNPKHNHHSTSGTTITHGHANSPLASSRYLLSDDDHRYSAEDMISSSLVTLERPSLRSAHALGHYLKEPQSSPPPPSSSSRALVPLHEPSSVQQPRLSSSSRNNALVSRHEPLPSPSRSHALVRHEQSSSSLKSHALVPPLRTRSVNRISADSSPAYLPAHHQVVVLRVSLHCKGCEAKVRKHVSRMEGVTSFDIDFANKKVTVTGDVTPLGVLASVSKVKNAEFWASSSPTSN